MQMKGRVLESRHMMKLPYAVPSTQVMLAKPGHFRSHQRITHFNPFSKLLGRRTRRMLIGELAKFNLASLPRESLLISPIVDPRI